MNKWDKRELELINRSEGILRGLLRFNRVNESDMPLIAEMISSYLNNRNYGRHDEKTISVIIDSLAYFHDNKNKE